MNYWLAIGPEKNWEIGIANKTWGASPAHAKTWGRIQPGDVLVFYVMSPVKGVVGYGKVTKTYVDETPFWPQEKEKGESMWPFRIVLGDLQVLPRKEWETKRVMPEKGIVLQRAFQPIAEVVAQDWLNRLRSGSR